MCLHALHLGVHGTHLLHGAGGLLGDLESACPLRFEAAPDLDAGAGSHHFIVRRVSSRPDVAKREPRDVRRVASPAVTAPYPTLRIERKCAAAFFF